MLGHTFCDTKHRDRTDRNERGGRQAQSEVLQTLLADNCVRHLQIPGFLFS